MNSSSHLPACEDGTTECTETLAYKIQTPGNYSEESIQHSEYGDSLKSRRENILHWQALIYVNVFPLFNAIV